MALRAYSTRREPRTELGGRKGEDREEDGEKDGFMALEGINFTLSVRDRNLAWIWICG